MTGIKRQKVLTPVQKLLGEDFNIAVFISVFRKSLIWVVLFVVGSITLIFLYLRYTYPTYQSTTRLIYKQDIASQTFDFISRGQKSAFNNVEIIRSPIILDPVIKSLPLEVSYFEKDNILNNEFYGSSPFKLVNTVKNNSAYNRPINFTFENNGTYSIEYEVDETYTYQNIQFGSVLETPHFDLIASIGQSGNEGLSEREFFFILNDRGSLINRIAANLTITPYSQGGQILQIDLKDKIAARSVDILNEISKEYIRKDVESRRQSNESVLAFLNNQIDTLGDDLLGIEDSLKDFKLTNRLLNPDALINLMLGDLNTLEQRKMNLEMEKRALHWLREYIEEGKNIEAISNELIDLTYTGYTSYIKELKQKESEIKELRLSLKEDHLQIRFLRNQIEEIKVNLFENLDNAMDRLILQQKQLGQEIGDFNSKFEGISEVEAEFSQLSRVKNLMETYFMNFLKKRLENEIKKASIVENYEILSKASHGVLVAPKKRLLQISGLAFGLILGMGLVVLRYLLISKIQTLSEVEDNSEVPLLGTVPNFKKTRDKFDLVVYDNPKSIITESFRTLRSNLEFISSGEGPKTMAVSSTVSGEGKTYIAINMAGVLNMAGKKVIVLDLDLRKPKIHKIFNVENLQGMSTILIGKHTYQECLHQVGYEGFQFINSGPIPPNPAELILSGKLKELIETLKQGYDFIICDTPPLGLVADALELMKFVDYPIYVIRNDFSRKEFINFPNKLYRDSGLEKLSIVLNDLQYKRSGYGRYNYNYGYGYGEGYYTETSRNKKSVFRRLFKS